MIAKFTNAIRKSPLPDDDIYLAELAGMALPEWLQRGRAAMNRSFTVGAGAWHLRHAAPIPAPVPESAAEQTPLPASSQVIMLDDHRPPSEPAAPEPELFDLVAEQERVGRPITHEQEFDELWPPNGKGVPLFPRTRGCHRSTALTVFVRLRRGGVSFDDIRNGVLRFAAAMSTQEERFIKHPETWLRNRGWETQYANRNHTAGHGAEPRTARGRGLSALSRSTARGLSRGRG